MRGTGTLESLIGKVHMMSRGNHDQVIPVSEIEFSSLDTARISGKEVAVLPSAQRLIANKLRIPMTYLERCPTELQAYNLTHWIQEEAKNRDTLFCRFSGDCLRAVFSDFYKPSDNLEVLYAMLEHGIAPSQEVQYLLSESLMVVKVPDYSRSFDVALRDSVIPGTGFSNSEIGMLAFGIDAYLYRITCENGLVAKATVTSKWKHTSSARKALDDFPSALNAVVADSQRSQDQFMLSTRTPVTNPMETIARLNSQLLVTQKMAAAVERAWPLEEGNTLFSIINCYTRSAQDPALDVEDALHLEKVGGLVLSMVSQ